MSYKIEKGISIPKNGSLNGRISKYPFGEMEVGDSFDCGEYSTVKMSNVLSCALNWSKRNRVKRKFTARKTGETFRIWRIK